MRTPILTSRCASFISKKIKANPAASKPRSLRREGRFCLIQDADLEYSPADYPALLRPLLAGEADLVIGSRYLESRERRVHRFWHSRINRLFTLLHQHRRRP